MNNELQHLIDEAAKRGIVPGATIRTAWPSSGSEIAIVPDTEHWALFPKTDLTFKTDGNDVWIKDLESSRWATVITPATSKEGGLKEGDACECGPAMRDAIIEVAKELNILAQDGDFAGNKGVYVLRGGVHAYHGKTPDDFATHTPEAFIAKMRITAKNPKPIKIGDHTVEFCSSFIRVGCTTIDNSVVRAITEKLID